MQILVEPNGNNGSELVNAILGAKSSIHMTMYLLTWSDVLNALIQQKQAGLEVKVVLNQNLPSGTSNQTAYDMLNSAGVQVVWAPSQFTYTHEKCVILDGKEAWIMTMNASYSSPMKNREYLAVDDNPTDVAEAEAVFEADFANTAASGNGPLLVAPINARSQLVSLIQSATRTIDIEAEEMSDYMVVNALAAAAQGGVTVHVVLANTTPSSSQQQAETQLKGAGVNMVTLATPYIHAKSLVVDGARAYVGSENFSTGSLQYNRELGLIFNVASEVQKVLSTTAMDFAAGTAL